MSNSKNYNSIVFLTTLSVYLGLVLVGGTSPVLAQAALTQRFEIQHEIETEDDLDKKPDKDKLFFNYSSAFENLYNLSREFYEQNKDKLRDNKYEFNCSLIFKQNFVKSTRCEKGSGIFWSAFIKPMENIGNTFFHTQDEKTDQVEINLSLSESDFSIKNSFTQNSIEQAEKFSKFYDAQLSEFRLDQRYNLGNLVSQNTVISFENNQVFIVTRLPRASIDAQLAETNTK